MDLKNIKAIAQSFTKKPSLNTGQQKFTVEPLKASKSTYKKHKLGLKSEERVVRLFSNQGYQLLKQRFKTPFSEVDLLFKKQNKLIMVEVKSSYSFTYISERQHKALAKSYYFLLEKYKLPIYAHLALVEKNKIHIIPDFLSQ